MGLTVVTGRANAGKSGWLYSRLETSAKQGITPTLLLPTHPDVRRAEQEFAQRGVLGVRIGVLDTWLWELWELHGDGRRPVGAATRALAVAQACEEAAPEGLQPGCRSPGFVRLVQDLARRSAGFDPHAITPRAAGFVDILECYGRLLRDEGLIEAGEAARVLSGAGLVLDGPAAANRFTELGPWQEELLVGLAAANDVSVALSWEEGFPATEALDGVVGRLSAAGERVVIPPPESEGELAELERRMFTGGAPHAPSGAVALGEAAGNEAEVVLAADVVEELIEGGYAPERIVLVFRQLDGRAGALVREFAARGIDADMDLSIPFSRVPLGRATLALLDACSGRAADRETLLAYLLSRYCSIAQRSVARADVQWRRERLGGDGLLECALDLERDPHGPLHLARDLAKRESAREYAGRKWHALADRMLSEAARHAELDSQDWLADAAARRTWMTTVSEAAALPEPGASEAAIAAALREAVVSTGARERAGAVQITEAHRVRSRRFDVVIVGGLTAEEFSSERPQALASDLLAEMNVPTGVEDRLRERMLFYTLATRARDKVVLLRQVSDSDGRTKRPSAFWEEVLDLYRDAGDPDAPDHPFGIPVARLSVRDAATVAPVFTHGRRSERQARATPSSERPPRGVLTRPESAFIEREYSVSELETYLACPYRWFLTSVLRPQELDRSLDAAERGTRAHRILARFYARWEGRIAAEQTEEALRLLDEVAAEVSAEACVQTRGIAEELAAARAVQWARSIIIDDVDFLPGFTPQHHEWRFGEERTRAVETNGVRLRGSIDRIDVGPAGIVLTDYKSSTVHGWQSFETHGLVQLPAYATVARSLMGEPVVGGLYRSMSSLATRGFARAGCLGVRGHGKAKDELSAEEIDSLLDAAAVRVREAAEGIQAGRIERRPFRKDSCTYCLARRLCARGGDAA